MLGCPTGPWYHLLLAACPFRAELLLDGPSSCTVRLGWWPASKYLNHTFYLKQGILIIQAFHGSLIATVWIQACQTWTGIMKQVGSRVTKPNKSIKNLGVYHTWCPVFNSKGTKETGSTQTDICVDAAPCGLELEEEYAGCSWKK